MTLIGLLIAIIVVCVILYAVNIALSFVEVDPRLKQLIWLVIFVVIIILVFSWLTGGLDVGLGGVNQNQKLR